MTISLPHSSWLAATAIALSSITTTVAAAEYKVLSVGDGDTIRVTCPTGINKTTVRLAKLPMAMMQERYCISNYQTSTGAI